MFRLVTGVSKSGKTEYVRNYLSALAQQGENKLLMIVPDQQTFDCEKAFLEMLGPMKAMNVKVLGFSRLCDYVFEMTGYVPSTIADESVKTLVMSMALEDTADLLGIYSQKALSTDLLSTMLSLDKELKASKITPDLLGSFSAEDNNILSEKLKDVQLVLSAYDALLSSSFEDPDCELSIACEQLKKNRLFEDYYICVDSFLSFTKVELDVLRLLIVQSKEMLVTLSDDGKNNEDSIFEISRSTGRKLTSFAKDEGVSVGSTIRCDYDGYFSNPQLDFVEKNIYTNTPDFIPISANVSESPVSIFCATDTYDEADFVARKIRELVMTKGLRYKDIAVVTRDMSAYFGVLDTALTKYGISYFMDMPGHIHSKPLMKLISACFDCITSSFQKDAVLSILKTGLTSADDTSISMFENYIFKWGISGTKFYNEFKANPRGFEDEFTTDDLYELSKVEKLRKSLIEPLLVFRENVKSATGETICRELYTLLIQLGADKKVIALCDKYEEQGYEQLAEEQIRLWQVFTDTLDRTIKVIGERVVPPKRFSELLKLQFAAQDMAFIPKAADQVTIGDIERLRLTDKKVVFVIGAEDGKFPRSPKTGGLFTPAERMILTDSGLLSDNGVELDSLREDYLCYYALTSASDALYISYSVTSLLGATIYPSKIISRLKGLFTDLTEIYSSDVDILDKLWASEPSFAHYISRMGSDDKLTKVLEEYYSSNDKYKDTVAALNRAVNKQELKISDPEAAQTLFGKDMYLSASQVERFYLCRFKYFCDYGLRIRERRVAEIDPLEFGTFVHHILEHFISKYDKSDLMNLTSDEIKADIDFITKEYADRHFGGTADKSQRFIYLLNRVGVYAYKVIEHLIEELLQSSFVPAEFEFDIGKDVSAYKLTLPTGQNITIRGKVDRIDLMKKDGRTYIRVVDYKTHDKIFDLSDVLYGLNLQMLIYLSVLTKNGKEAFGTDVIPSGVLYMKSMISVINAAFSDTQENIDKEINKTLAMNGLILRDMDVIQGMEREMSGIYIPVSVKKGELKGADNLATLAEFGAIFSRIDLLVSEMASELYKGKIGAIPTKGGTDGCEYCPYSAVCCYKDTDPHRNVFKLDRESILKELGIEEEEDSE